MRSVLLVLALLGACRKENAPEKSPPSATTRSELAFGLDGPPKGCREAPAQDVIDVAVAEGRLWIVNGENQLFSYDSALDTYRQHLHGSTVLAVRETHDGSLWALTRTGDPLLVQRREGESWRPVHRFEARDVTMVHAFREHEGRPVLLVGWRLLHLLDDGRVLTITFAPSPEHAEGYMVMGVTADGDAYVGDDCGEWGGELQHVRLSAGALPARVPQRAEDPIWAIEPHPERANCVLLGTHRAYDLGGGLRRACGDQTELVFERKLDLPSTFTTDGIRALMTRGEVVYALGDKALYHLRGADQRWLSMPEREDRCGLRVRRRDVAWDVQGGGVPAVHPGIGIYLRRAWLVRPPM